MNVSKEKGHECFTGQYPPTEKRLVILHLPSTVGSITFLARIKPGMDVETSTNDKCLALRVLIIMGSIVFLTCIAG